MPAERCKSKFEYCQDADHAVPMVLLGHYFEIAKDAGSHEDTRTIKQTVSDTQLKKHVTLPRLRFASRHNESLFPWIAAHNTIEIK